MKTLLITPPLLQINAPYPATPYLTSYLESCNLKVEQRDLSLDLLLMIFSKSGLEQISKSIKGKSDFIVAAMPVIDDVVEFLQGKNNGFEKQILSRNRLPESNRVVEVFSHPARVEIFNELSKYEQAKYLATLFLLEIIDEIKIEIDPDFQIARYRESLASSNPSFTPLYKKLNGKDNIIDQFMESLIHTYISQCEPDVVGFTTPFPGNVYGALKAAQILKKLRPKIKIVMGGGYVNTELRSLADTRFFEFVDYLVFDDGEIPLSNLIKCLSGKLAPEKLVRTWYVEKNKSHAKIIKCGMDLKVSQPFKENLGPTYRGLNLDKYLSMIDTPNPMMRMWSEHRWNKMILAHGCYWKKCTFCDVSLDYIKRFEPQKADTIAEQMVQIAKETGFNGFHFVDEAAPPALLKQLSEVIIKRNLKFKWWGNIRFDKQFDFETTRLMSEAGCIAVTGGLEVASPRVLEMINKGVTIEQVARVTKNFRNHGVFVHAYLIYGFPSETTQETIDSLEVVRQLFLNGCIDSGFWHRFAATVHSPVGQDPKKYGITLNVPKAKKMFAINGVEFKDKVKTPNDKLGVGLDKAIYNYMHGVGLKEDVRAWFDFKVPKATLKNNYINKILAT